MDFTLSEPLKKYLTPEQKDLIKGGFHLIDHVHTHADDKKFVDYSFVVFPFAKAYEGFLKQVFLDSGFITKKDFLSQYFRVGKVMSPNLARRLKNKSVYKQMCDTVGCDLGDRIWAAWRKGRNEVFHYFPDNVHALDLNTAEGKVMFILETMEMLVRELEVGNVKEKLRTLAA